MKTNTSKIYQRTSLIILAIIISSLLNVCMFTLQAKAAPIPLSKVNFIYNNGDTCILEPVSEPEQTINRKTAPMPECCLAQNRNFDAIVNTATDKSAPTFGNLIISPSTDLNFKNNSTHNTSRFIHPPPEALALASTVIRE